MNTNVTIVTGLWDIGRGEIGEGFRRPFDHYLQKFAELLKCDNYMYIYLPKELEDFVWEVRSKDNTRLRLMDVPEFKTWFGFYDKVQAIREKPEWYNQAGWLADSPQAKLADYNPIVMSKMFMLNDASIFNPFNTEYFFWIDGGISNTVHPGYFWKDKVFDNLPYYYDLQNKFLFLSYPYIGGEEIHGFTRDKIAKYSDVDYVEYVCRGGFFGGRKDHLNNINSLYYNYLQSSLNEGLMGTEESIFLIMAHRHEELIQRFELGGDGMVWPFFEQLKDVKEREKVTVSGKKPFSETKVSLYVITFNSPTQFEHLCKSFEVADRNFLDKPRKIVLNNSTDEGTHEEYQELFTKYGFEEIKKDNIGIQRGRVFCAEHFGESDSDYMFFFEDDMLLMSPTPELDKFGFRRYISGLYDKTVKIAYETDYDFIKLSFCELYGSNDQCWPWYNIPQDVRTQYFPNKRKLPVQGLDPNPPKTEFKNISLLYDVPVIDGEVYMSNWPQIINKSGSQKCYLDVQWAGPFEATTMSYVYQEQKKGNIKSAIFLLSPINHDRIVYYGKDERREN